jgi:hypothetical protein
MYSEPLEKIITDLGAETPFDKISERLFEHHGIYVPTSSARNITQKHAQKIFEQQQIQRNGSSQIAVECVIAMADGAFIPLVDVQEGADKSKDLRKTRSTRWAEAKLTLAYKKGSATPIFEATMGDVDDAGKKIKQCISRVGFDEKTQVHFLGDGAPWIAEQVDKQFGSQANYLIDFFHLSQYLNDAAQCCYPINTIEWFHEQQKNVKNNQLESLLKSLLNHIEANQCELKTNCLAEKCYNYMIKRIDKFNYKDAIDSNLPIGSGEIESAHKYVVQKRLKLPGAWWKLKNAIGMIALRVMRANNDWKEYWDGLSSNFALGA